MSLFRIVASWGSRVAAPPLEPRGAPLFTSPLPPTPPADAWIRLNLPVFRASPDPQELMPRLMAESVNPNL